MNRALGAMLALVAGLASGALLLEIRTSEVAAPGAVAPRAAPAVQAPAVSDNGREALATILARPLFNPGRRAAPGAANSGPAAVLPRLSGIVIDASGRSAIFAPADGTKSLVVREGSALGEWSVRSIDHGTVTLVGPVGSRVVHPGPAPTGPAPERPAALPARKAEAVWLDER
jgi:hypothetical protein